MLRLWTRYWSFIGRNIKPQDPGIAEWAAKLRHRVSVKVGKWGKKVSRNYSCQGCGDCFSEKVERSI